MEAYLVVNVDIGKKRISSGRDSSVVWDEDGVVERAKVGTSTVRHLGCHLCASEIERTEKRGLRGRRP